MTCPRQTHAEGSRSGCIVYGPALAMLLWAGAIHAAEEPPNPLATAVLGATVSSAFAAADFTEADFAVEWEGPVVSNVQVALQPNSLQWVTTSQGLVLPRAVLTIHASAIQGGLVEHVGVAHPLRSLSSGDGHLELPVALLSGQREAVKLRIRRAGEESIGVLALRFHPRPKHRRTVVIDSTCSPYAVRISQGQIPDDTWLQLHCRMVPVERGDTRSATLELLAYWDNVGPTVNLAGLEIHSRPPGLFSMRLEPQPGVVHLATPRGAVGLGYRLPPRVYAGFVTAGIGPYFYTMQDGGTDLQTAANLLTLYAGYTLTPKSRIVYFNATTLHARPFTDQGLYLWLEQTTLFDGRLSVNLLLGMHALLFEGRGELRFVPSFPQGIEAIFRDFGLKAHNLSGGAFAYPEILGRSYYNLWLRWGSARMFWEANYIAWKEPLGAAWVQSKSLGITVGVPLWRFM